MGLVGFGAHLVRRTSTLIPGVTLWSSCVSTVGIERLPAAVAGPLAMRLLAGHDSRTDS